MADNLTVKDGLGSLQPLRTTERGGVHLPHRILEPWLTARLITNGAVNNAKVYGGLIVTGITTADQITIYNGTGSLDPTKIIDLIPSGDISLGQEFSPADGVGLACSDGLYVNFGISWNGTIVVKYR
jgi:hypothetical protein